MLAMKRSRRPPSQPSGLSVPLPAQHLGTTRPWTSQLTPLPSNKSRWQPTGAVAVEGAKLPDSSALAAKTRTTDRPLAAKIRTSNSSLYHVGTHIQMAHQQKHVILIGNMGNKRQSVANQQCARGQNMHHNDTSSLTTIQTKMYLTCTLDHF